MGERNKSTEAVILNISRQGENNWTATVLSPDAGIFYATVYGGAKSRMRSLVQQFNSGLLYYYDDSQKNMRKISDFDVRVCHQTFRSSIYKVWAANLAAELVLKTKAAGEYTGAFTLLCAYLDGIDASDEKGARLGTLRFLWRYLRLLGVQPDVSSCASCSSPLFLNDGQDTGEKSAYIAAANGFLCRDCLASYGQSKESMRDAAFASRTSLLYLDAVNTQSPGRVRVMTLCADDAFDIKRLCYMLAEQAAGCRLKTLESGALIL